MDQYIKLINKLFESRVQSHVYHLQSEEYAKHIALDAYYNEISPIIDDLVEIYQGQYDEILSGYDMIVSPVDDRSDVLQYFTELGKWLMSNRMVCINKDDLHLQALLDDVLNLLFKTKYKLKFLK